MISDDQNLHPLSENNDNAGEDPLQSSKRRRNQK